jgi:hypothetical protein
VIAFALLAQAGTEGAVERAQVFTRADALTVRRVRRDPRVPAGAKLGATRVAAVELDRIGEAGRLEVEPRSGQSLGVGFGPAQDQPTRTALAAASLDILTEPSVGTGVVIGKPFEAELLAEHPRRNATREQRRLDEQRGRAAERVEERRALVPSGEKDDRSREGLGEWGAALKATPAAFVERRARGVDRNGAAIAKEMDMDAKVRVLLVHARSREITPLLGALPSTVACRGNPQKSKCRATWKGASRAVDSSQYSRPLDTGRWLSNIL